MGNINIIFPWQSFRTMKAKGNPQQVRKSICWENNQNLEVLPLGDITNHQLNRTYLFLSYSHIMASKSHYNLFFLVTNAETTIAKRNRK